MVSRSAKMEAPSPPQNGNPKEKKGPAAKGVALKIYDACFIQIFCVLGHFAFDQSYPTGSPTAAVLAQRTGILHSHCHASISHKVS